MLNFRFLNRLYYMMILIFAVAIVAATFIPLNSKRDVSHAQSTNTPTILSFTSDLESITPDDAESGETMTTLTWETAGMSDVDALTLDVYVLGDWHNALEVDSILAPSDAVDVSVPHTLDFQEPTWRLSIVTGDDRQILTSQELRLAYDIDTEMETEIIVFEADVDSIDINELVRGAAQIPVAWEVVNRMPNSNLQFVQLYNAGNVLGTVNVELPRDVEWIRSKDEGLLAPVVPPNTRYYSRVMLRLQVVDRDDPTILYAFEDISVRVQGELISTRPARTPVPTRTLKPTSSSLANGSGGCNTDFFFEEAGREYVFNGGVDLNWVVFDLCPTSGLQSSYGVFQMYENGFMLWKASPEPGQVYFFNNDGQGAAAETLYVGADVVIHETPPAGQTILPDGILGEAWARRRDLSQALGWPVGAPEEYELLYQDTQGGQIEGMVMTLPSGGRFFLRYGITGERPLTWAWINATN